VSPDLGFDFEELERKGIVATRREAPSNVQENISVAVLGGGFWAVFLGIGIASAEPRFGISAAMWPYAVWSTLVLIIASVVAVLIIRGTNSRLLVVRWTMNAVALMVILAIGLGLPAATIYFFGGGRQLLAPAPPGAAPELALFARLMQLALIATASLLPVLLFFLFDRYQLSTLRKRLYASLFRLDRTVTTISEIKAKYGSQIHEAYGSDSQGRGRLTPGTRWPVLVCAFVMTLAWIMVLAPVGELQTASAMDVLGSLSPRRTPLVFGFLGVYFFSLRLIALRYARGDLKPKAYTSIMVRLFIVLVLSWVLEAIFTGESTVALMLAFLFGITPDEFFTWLKQIARDTVPASAFPQATLPLNELEGIDLYDLARLESEGIVNIEGLAHHELIDLIIETRIPVPRLIDWVDQAILYLHIIGSGDASSRTELRKYGIRTATDLICAWNNAVLRGQSEIDAFKRLLGGAQPPYRLEVIRDVLSDDEWFAAISCWRRDEPHQDREERSTPSSVDALVSMAQIERQAERYPRALRLLKQSLTIEDTPLARRRIAALLATVPVLELQDSSEALVHADRAFHLAPDDLDGAIELCETYSQLNEFDRAQSMYELAAKILDSWSTGRKREKEAGLARLAVALAYLNAKLEAKGLPLRH
jgi:tetratricopeptide (TPR) repeat protein